MLDAHDKMSFRFKTPQQLKAQVRRYQKWLGASAKQPDLYGTEFPLDLFLVVGPEEVDEMIKSTPPDRLMQLKQELDRAPSTEQEWDKLFILGSSTASVPMQEIWVGHKAIYREAVELLRDYFTKNQSS